MENSSLNLENVNLVKMTMRTQRVTLSYQLSFKVYMGFHSFVDK